MTSVTSEDVYVPAPHPPEFRRRAVELARAGHTPVAKLAKELRISESCLRNWMAQADADEAGSETRLTNAEKKELAELRRANRRLEGRKRDPQARRCLFRQGERAPKVIYRWVQEMAADDLDVAVACRVLGVSTSGYYDWLSRPASARERDNELLLKHIAAIHAESRGTYGWPRVHAELTLGLGLPVNHKRVERLMRQAGLQSLYRRRSRRPAAMPATEEDLVARQFTVEAPDRLWFTDITEYGTAQGKLYCAAVMDAFSRLVIGWSMADNLRTELVTDALGMAILRRQPTPDGTILHSDHGAQYTSWAFGQRLRNAGLLGSMGTVGDCYDCDDPGVLLLAV